VLVELTMKQAAYTTQGGVVFEIELLARAAA